MRNEWKGPMPAPHQCVMIRVRRPDWKVEVDYRGTREQLRAAGVVDDLMENKILNQRSGRMLNHDGLRFHLSDRTKPKRIVWASGGEIGITFEAHPERALKLPGVRELLPDGILTNDDARGARTPDGRMQERDRCVGRWQRQVRWFQIDNVIWPDWREVRSGFSRGMMPVI